ncbi:ATP-binding cassette domain-containing protein [Mucilaginibacter sp. UR6-1]|uniref:ATP-binding cassette domain-containing protein n=1 Tax=Mucilaginibacter sp. UR6-1 TaxID=1435643 RepID=UPI001E36E985|nr:ATP-binding cassette domain-containing protein [Mucilaginibacter sp. UR6-1]MCC8411052.1 ATP-binding cassette domain-containing protein [Mucilaginibacter sp. UR6-1]
MIEINIQKKLNIYSGEQVLDFTGQLPLNTITKISGPSGAGKTTLLKIIAGLITPENGRVIVEGTTWLDTEKKINLSPQKRLTGFVFQDHALFPNMTVLQHLQYATNDKQWINHLLSIAEMTAFASNKPSHLSGGQQQRLAVIRALAVRPKLILMDEPFSALDTKTKARFTSALSSLFSNMRMTALIVSHNPQELDAFAGEEISIGE